MTDLLCGSVEELVETVVGPKVQQLRRATAFGTLVRVLGSCRQDAEQSWAQGALERAYVFAMVFATGVLEVACRHPGRAGNEALLRGLRRAAAAHLARLEALKPRLEALYAAAAAQRAADAAQRAAAQRDYAARLEQAAAAAAPTHYYFPVVPNAVASKPPPPALPQVQGNAAVPAVTVASQPPPPPPPLPPAASVHQVQGNPAVPAIPAAAAPPPQNPYRAAADPYALWSQPQPPQPQPQKPQPPQQPQPPNALREDALAHYTRTPLGARGLRRLVLPRGTVDAFVACAAAGTARGVETCALLSGRLAGGALVVTHCVVPPQRGSADACAVLDELAVFACHEAHGLITLGWIHTHPTQSLFLSSVDLHTTLPYQQLLAEAVAVVVAPHRRPQHAVFALTPAGLAALAACTATGFHAHTEPALYGTPTHVVLQDGAPTVIDLRT